MVGMVRGKGYRKRPYEKIEQWMNNEISFPSVPRCRLVKSPIILEAFIKGFQVHKIYVDGGSSLEVMYEHCFRNLGPKTRAKLRESKVSLVGFSWEVNYPLGVIDLSVTMRELDMIRTVTMEFVVVKCHSPYNVILGQTGIRSLGAVASTIHSMIKFPTANVIATVITKRETLQECRRIKEVQGSAPEGRVTHPRIRSFKPKDAPEEGGREFKKNSF
ncbi:reverse transcriptase domain-containing protein [Tanacetum coccineum]